MTKESNPVRKMEEYQFVANTSEGVSTKTIRSLDGNIYIVKHMDMLQTVSEYVGAHFARLIIGNKAPVVTLVKDDKGKTYIASKFIENFKTMYDYFQDTKLPQECFPNGCIIDSNGELQPIVPYLQQQINYSLDAKVEEHEAIETTIAFTQHTDAHDRNKGVVVKNGQIQAAIIDFSHSMGRVWNDMRQEADVQTRSVYYSKDADPIKILKTLNEITSISEVQKNELLNELFADLKQAYPNELPFLEQEQLRVEQFITARMKVFNRDKAVFEMAMEHDLKFTRSIAGNKELYNLRLDKQSFEKLVSIGDDSSIRALLKSSLSGLESSMGKFDNPETFEKIVRISETISPHHGVNFNLFMLAIENQDYKNAAQLFRRGLSFDNLSYVNQQRFKAIFDKGDVKTLKFLIKSDIRLDFFDHPEASFHSSIADELAKFHSNKVKYKNNIDIKSLFGINSFPLKSYEQYSKEIFPMEGVGEAGNIYNRWVADTADKLEKLQSSEEKDYKIPPITHVVYFTQESDPKPWKDLYITKYTATSKELSDTDPNFRHMIWTNDPNSIPEKIRKLPGVEIKTMDELSNDSLMPDLRGKLDDAQRDPRKFVEASDIARVMAEKKYGGVYHDLDYEVIEGRGKDMVKFMKNYHFFNAKEFDWQDASIGNAFFAACPDHPIMLEYSNLISRNLNLLPDTPEYVLRPKNEVQRVLFQTGPVAMTMAVYRAWDKSKQLGYNDMIFDNHILYNFELVRKDPKDRLPKTKYFRKGFIPMETVGGDEFGAGWAQNPDYTREIHYEDIKVPNIMSGFRNKMLPGPGAHGSRSSQNSISQVGAALALGLGMYAVGKAVYGLYEYTFGTRASTETLKEAKTSMLAIDKLDLNKVYALREFLLEESKEVISSLNSLYDARRQNSNEYKDLREELSKLEKHKDNADRLLNDTVFLRENAKVLIDPNVKEGYVTNIIKEAKALADISIELSKTYNIDLSKQKKKYVEQVADERGTSSSHGVQRV